ncbi:DedA family protein [Nonomuraea sp. NPDC050556]|uniref:DedA family protein n=1 Tax=Nonomuraea sp. NPDC050556 TaxID=3364369 RepID=UPI00378B4559
MFNDLLDTLASQDIGVVWPLMLAFLTLDASVGVGLIIPGDALLIVAGTTADSPAEALALIAAGVLACAAGATGGHWLGRKTGPRLRYGRLGRRIGEERWLKAEALFERSGWALAVAYFLPVVHALTPAVAGTLGVPYRKFMPWALTGATAWVSAYVALGALASGVVRENAGLLVPVAAVAAVAVAGLAAVARRALSGGRRARKNGHAPEDRQASEGRKAGNTPEGHGAHGAPEGHGAHGAPDDSGKVSVARRSGRSGERLPR